MTGTKSGIKIPLAIVITVVLFSVGLSLGAVKYIYGQDAKKLEQVRIENQTHSERIIRLEEKFLALKEDTSDIKSQVEKLNNQYQASTNKILNEIRRSK